MSPWSRWNIWCKMWWDYSLYLLKRSKSWLFGYLCYDDNKLIWSKTDSASQRTNFMITYHLHKAYHVPDATQSTFSSVQFSCSVMPCSLWPHEPQHARPPCPSSTPGVHSNPCPSSWWCHLTTPHPLSCPSPPAFNLSQYQGLFQWVIFASGGQNTGVSASASVLPMNIQDWFPLGLTGLISLQSKGLSRVFSYSIVQKHQFFSIQLSL